MHPQITFTDIQAHPLGL